MASNLPLDDIVRIVVNLSPRSAARRGFNVGLFVGTADVIPTSERVRLYSSTQSMLDDGFTDSDPEYVAAGLYFSQNPRPLRVAIGRHDTSEVMGEFDVTATAGTTLGDFDIAWDHIPDGADRFVYYTPFSLETLPEYLDVLTAPWQDLNNGDTISVTDGATFVVVAELNAQNQVVNLGAAQLGGASVSLGLPVAESITDAVRACRVANTEWYLFSYLGANPSDIINLARFAEAARPECVQFYTTDEPLVLVGDPTSVFAQLRALNFRRTLGQYSSTPYAVAGIMGYAMGANTRLSRSAYTLMHKLVRGVMPDGLSETQVDNITNNNGNYYVSRGNNAEYSMFEDGRLADATWFDEIINLDMLVNDMQLAIVDLLVSRPKVPQTEAGVLDIKGSMRPSLSRMRTIGFIAPGQWNGANIYTEGDYAPLQTGDFLDTGYMILSEPIDSQTQAERDARIAPPIYVAIKLAGAIHTVLVRIDVNR